MAADIINNGRELLTGNNINWDLVLNQGIRTQQLTSVQSGEAAIAILAGPLVGGLAAAAGWAMHDPAMVYLSGKYLANKASDRFVGFKNTMLYAAIAYGHKVLPNAELYMEVLDFSLEVQNRNRYRKSIKDAVVLLGSGEIEKAYNIMKSCGDPVRRRAP